MSRLVIEAGKTERAYWSDLWRYRELFFFLSWRDILVRYKQTVIGILWAVIRPVLTTIVFVLVFGKLAKMPSGGVPYPVLVYAAMLPWQFFSSALSEASNSLVASANMLSKIYFPRLIVPASAVIVCFVDFLISAAILAVLMAWYHVMPGWRLAALPLFTLLGLGAALGVSLWLAALNVKYRDFRYVIPFIVQFGLYLSPVGFSSEAVLQRLVEVKSGEILYLLYLLNPMVGVIDGFRWAIEGQAAAGLNWCGVLISMLVAAMMLVSGLRYFRSVEKTFADII
jgi:lipopolysaccharide transport system permease protein